MWSSSLQLIFLKQCCSNNSIMLFSSYCFTTKPLHFFGPSIENVPKMTMPSTAYVIFSGSYQFYRVLFENGRRLFHAIHPIFQLAENPKYHLLSILLHLHDHPVFFYFVLFTLCTSVYHSRAVSHTKRMQNLRSISCFKIKPQAHQIQKGQCAFIYNL